MRLIATEDIPNVANKGEEVPLTDSSREALTNYVQELNAGLHITSDIVGLILEAVSKDGTLQPLLYGPEGSGYTRLEYNH